MHRRILVLLLLVFGFGATACESSEPTQEGMRRVTLQLNWFPEPEFGGFYAARDNGHFASEGIEIDLRKGGADVPAGQLVANGNVDFAIVSGSQLVTLRAQGGRATAVFATFQKSPRALVVKWDSPYRQIEDLWRAEGTIMAQNGLPFIKWLNQSLGTSNLKFIPYTGSFAPFLQNTVVGMQAFATAEPVQLESDGVRTRVFLVADAGFNPYDVIVAVSDRLLEEDPELVTRMVRAMSRGWEDYLASPQATNKTIGELNPDFSPRTLEIAAAALPNFLVSEDTRSNRLGWMTDARWTSLQDKLVSLGELDAERRKGIGRIFLNPTWPVDSETSPNGKQPVAEDARSATDT